MLKSDNVTYNGIDRCDLEVVTHGSDYDNGVLVFDFIDFNLEEEKEISIYY
ncbi:hypothetical protein AAGT10_05585 [Sulfolobus tengchongensis]|uniref:hypothetical protein n=1 Tax=Saccharolobus shibatae TaxID=2286 RepID=UPI001F0D9FF2|nr:hypothetical protein [Saccharolobus shibatae]MCH4816855.1 hypothetical protein [Saccharolobus shibatae]